MNASSFNIQEKFSVILGKDIYILNVLMGMYNSFQTNSFNSEIDNSVATLSTYLAAYDIRINKLPDLFKGQVLIDELSDDEVTEIITWFESAINSMKNRVYSGSLINRIANSEDIEQSILSFKEDIKENINRGINLSKSYELKQDFRMADLVNQKVGMEFDLMDNVSNNIVLNLQSNGISMSNLMKSYCDDSLSFDADVFSAKNLNFPAKQGSNNSILYRTGKGFYDFFRGTFVDTIRNVLNYEAFEDEILASIDTGFNMVSDVFTFANDIVNKGISSVNSRLSNYRLNKTYSVDAINMPIYEEYINASVTGPNIYFNRFLAILYNANKLGLSYPNFVFPFSHNQFEYKAILTFIAMSGQIHLVIYPVVTNNFSVFESDSNMEEFIVNSYNNLMDGLTLDVHYYSARLSDFSDAVINMQSNIDSLITQLYQIKSQDINIQDIANVNFDLDIDALGLDISLDETIEGIINPLINGINSIKEISVAVSNGIIDFSIDRLIDLASNLSSFITTYANGADIGTYLIDYFQDLIINRQYVLNYFASILFDDNGICDLTGSINNVSNLSDLSFSVKVLSVYENYENLGAVVIGAGALVLGTVIGVKGFSIVKKGISVGIDAIMAKRNRDKIINGVLDGMSDDSVQDAVNTESLRPLIVTKRKISKL